MDGETTIAQGLHVTDDSAGYDAACKRVLSEKAILARIMKSCLEAVCGGQAGAGSDFQFLWGRLRVLFYHKLSQPWNR